MKRFRTQVQTLAFQYPVIFSFIIMTLGIVLTEIHLENYLKSYIDFQSASYLTGIFEQGLCSIILAALISGLGLLKSAGFTRPKEWKQLWLIWPVIVLSILNGWSLFTGTIVIDTSKPTLILLFMLLYLSTGFFEEFLFRGVVTTVMLQKWGGTRKGIYLAVIVSSGLFGVLHIINFFMNRFTLLANFTQTIYALFFGVFFAACLLRHNSIWPVVGAHAIFDICGNFNEIAFVGNFGQIHQTTWNEAFATVIITLPLFIYGLFILRKVKPSTQSKVNEAGFTVSY